jgi:hypothetical protein
VVDLDHSFSLDEVVGETCDAGAKLMQGVVELRLMAHSAFQSIVFDFIYHQTPRNCKLGVIQTL